MGVYSNKTVGNTILTLKTLDFDILKFDKESCKLPPFEIAAPLLTGSQSLVPSYAECSSRRWKMGLPVLKVNNHAIL